MVRSASGVVWSGIGVVAPVSTCVPASSVKSAAASGNSCVACSAPAGGRGGISAKGSVAVAAPAGENTTVSPSPLSPLLPENTAMVGASAASSAARQMVRGLLRSTPPAAPKGASPPRLRQRSQPVVQPRLPRRTVPPARPAKRWDSTHPRRWHSAIDPACNDPCDPGPVQNGRQPMCRPVVRKDSRCPRPRAQVPPSSAVPNTGAPVAAKASTDATDHQSVASSDSAPSIISGAMNPGVPITRPVRVT